MLTQPILDQEPDDRTIEIHQGQRPHDQGHDLAAHDPLQDAALAILEAASTILMAPVP